ncbi:MAG TPA: TolC family protein, partial [Dongiaceae bacterium]
MKISILVVALLGAASMLGAPLSGQQTPAPQAGAMTLDEAMAAALAANPALAAARLGREEAQARGDVARQRPNPEIAIEESRDTPRDAATVSLPIERGGKRQRRIAVATAQARSNEADIARLTATTRNQVRRAYFGLAAAERRAHETAEIRGLAERARDAARARFESGDVPRLDALQ